MKERKLSDHQQENRKDNIKGILFFIFNSRFSIPSPSNKIFEFNEFIFINRDEKISKENLAKSSEMPNDVNESDQFTIGNVTDSFFDSKNQNGGFSSYKMSLGKCNIYRRIKPYIDACGLGGLNNNAF